LGAEKPEEADATDDGSEDADGQASTVGEDVDPGAKAVSDENEDCATKR
tara:strand:+ start:442 stop:588 length:147 start_codon:yes stop_codon:yes gene_type:complete